MWYNVYVYQSPEEINQHFIRDAGYGHIIFPPVVYATERDKCKAEDTLNCLTDRSFRNLQTKLNLNYHEVSDNEMEQCSLIVQLKYTVFSTNYSYHLLNSVYCAISAGCA